MAKLKKILKYICGDVHTRVYVVYNYNNEEKIDLIYAGFFSDIPWSLTEKEMVEADEAFDESYPLDFCDKLGSVPKEWDTGLVEDSSWDDRAGLCIFVKE